MTGDFRINPSSNEENGLKFPVFGRERIAPQKLSPVTIEAMYSAQLLDHFQNPRNAGDLADADATAEVENPVCGDVIRLSLNIHEGRITEIRFKAKGCVPSMACASAVTELAAGKTVKEALAINRDSLIAVVGGLPQASAHAAQVALDALAATLRLVQS